MIYLDHPKDEDHTDHFIGEASCLRYVCTLPKQQQENLLFGYIEKLVTNQDCTRPLTGTNTTGA